MKLLRRLLCRHRVEGIFRASGVGSVAPGHHYGAATVSFRVCMGCGRVRAEAFANRADAFGHPGDTADDSRRVA